MITITEELFLLALHDETGSIPNRIAIPLRFALGGAILTELLLAGKIQLNENKKVISLDRAPCDDPLLNEVLEKIKAGGHPRKVAYWIKEINHKPKKLLRRLGEGLVAKGILRQEEKHYLWVIPYVVFPQQDASAKFWVKQHLRSVILAGEIADHHAVMVLILAQASGMLDFVFTRDEIKTARKRIAKIARDSHLGLEINQAIAEIETAVAELVILEMSD
jgi:hypothetical protein